MVLNLLFITTVIKSTFGVVTTGLWLIPLMLAAITYYRYDAVDPESRPLDQLNLYPEYDFIVVGSGSAGAVVANRLSEVRKWKVLLIEAGPDENEISDVPSLAAYLQLSKLDWAYKTEPSTKACLGMQNNRCNWPRGRVLGGSSVLNYMLYVRGNRHDYDHWASLGNPGWDYDHVLRYFKKSEDNRNPYLANNKYHGRGGLLTVQESPWHSPLVAAFVEAGTQLGYDNRDINGAKQAGFMIAQGTIRRGSRCSTAKAFLRPIRARKNFHLSMNSHVTRIIIEPGTMRAQAVEFVKHGKVYRIAARREVILSAGAINTPQLMMLSGLGPRKHLEKHGIRVLQDLPVGENMQDHESWTTMPLLLRPRSRGSVKLRSANPFHYPLINANYFDDPLDAKTLVEGAKIALRVAEAQVFKQFGSRLWCKPLPNCKQHKFLSDAYLECHVRTISMTIYHPCGTAKMVPAWDPEAVVDPRLRVYVVRGLRVIDGCIMPTISSGNTNAPVIMIAEKGADLIKEDWLTNPEYKVKRQANRVRDPEPAGSNIQGIITLPTNISQSDSSNISDRSNMEINFSNSSHISNINFSSSSNSSNIESSSNFTLNYADS
ncbi:GM12028 [Drosophila sechellia]|uniref:GM12028 n=1 Tax=Drosophila sechellia TaxID=7238 RepID=B4IJ71_DROSE|nr:GM12028 [Drosophila sechellia]